MKVKSLSHIRLFSTPWTVAYQAPLSIGFSRQYYWSGLPFPFLGGLLNPGLEPWSPALQKDALPSETRGKYVTIKLFSFWEKKKKLHAWRFRIMSETGDDVDMSYCWTDVNFHHLHWFLPGSIHSKIIISPLCLYFFAVPFRFLVLWPGIEPQSPAES